LTLTYRISLKRNVPHRSTQPLMAFESYLDQIDPASGAGNTLADATATDIRVS
jgi:hypothetical protein